MEALLSDTIWIIIIVGWIFLIAAGLEADKPLSGGIPGNGHHHEEHTGTPTLWDQLGSKGSWIVFGISSLALPVVLWWIFQIH